MEFILSTEGRNIFVNRIFGDKYIVTGKDRKVTIEKLKGRWVLVEGQMSNESVRQIGAAIDEYAAGK
jgi:hypothetical protein